LVLNAALNAVQAFFFVIFLNFPFPPRPLDITVTKTGVLAIQFQLATMPTDTFISTKWSALPDYSSNVLARNYAHRLTGQKIKNESFLAHDPLKALLQGPHRVSLRTPPGRLNPTTLMMTLPPKT
jgi:hypothetical protein